ncbi:DUF4360 domain-containing protein [Allokutzneria albata]|uniref:DUF4360 domain-containing protein n=1 Tax=Allokutzneria albata TaxID=211114 RepID=A0A1G9YK00_ALLAB|nr:protein of unknown function [Allokutzneria albata]
MLRKLAVAGMSLALISIPAVAQADIAPPPDKIVIEVATVNGSGCPAGTAAVAVSPDNTAFTVTYSQYMAKVGPGISPTEARKNCQLNLKVHVPQGFTYAIAQSDYRGFANLARGATAIEQANYYFQGMSPTVAARHNFSGPLDDNWQTTDKVDIASLVYAPCGEKRNVNINTELRVSKGTSPATETSFIAMDSTDGSIKTTYHFHWKTCP